MKLDTFRRLRIPAQKDSPFCWEVLVKQDSYPPYSMGGGKDAETASFSPERAAAEADARGRTTRTVFVTSVSPLLSVAKLCRVLEDTFGEIEDVREKIVVQKSEQEHCYRRKTQSRSRLSCAGLQPACSAVRLLHFVFRSALSVSALLAAAVPLGKEDAPISVDLGKKSLKQTRDDLLASDGQTVDGSLLLGTRGVAAWLQEAGALGKTPDEMQRDVDEFMANHDLKKEIERQRVKQQQLTDEDGFTLVVGSSATASDGTTFKSIRRPDISGPSSLAAAGSRGLNPRDQMKSGTEEQGAINLCVQQNAAAAGIGGSDDTAGPGGRRRKKKRKGGIEEDFYRFQRREKKRKEFLDVQRALAADEKAVEAMEKANKFSL
ncbi:ribosomal RNA-processing protein 7 [Toxoplasma gondii TgCatPRC2]|uniref:Ribosomal RNA-processing protein 7 C-terminal domain-containing protein n=12 Tax=Toxoplasma gondii TaxID=5811 RepID=S7W7I8_TOXGG|nr:hypothetical protein TGGT1_258500 [Toxoplasma gondii GT1]KAF4641348.1 hypothetical protein TGRH88_071580 [Toxoplasma gondii]KFG29372.1 ribosomal RNA-processing protein 7 [Toxoplasma gondii p89]KFG33812.1 ribosomal RNA-processing protein 7 [Toxoplasma gondii GAB2-2007-GAL-DOM2]KFG38008.1 ribosomal RNA-processing protein 7 [Toxoplasma gondii FOU]KFG65124.1 ribosomal RNA-processing protein 7 [Toxoplasma gondii RUB]KFH00685.1 ribosomal RNA-processing protein 7 [Toxoplasma gondii VAND]KFH13262